MLVAASLGQVTSWGVLYYSFAVFIAPMQAELGWSLAELTGTYSLALLLSGVAAIPVGRWLDRHGPRALMTAGSLAATLLVVAWAAIDSLLGFYLIWAGIGLVMAAVFYEPAFYIVANWFKRLRGRALTLLTFVGGLASVVYIPLASRLVDLYGWRAALLVLAAILALGTIPIHALLLRRHPADLGLEPDGGSVTGATAAIPVAPERSYTLPAAMRDPSFWWLAVAFVLATMATMAMTVHLIPYLMSEGYGRAFAAGTAGAVGLLALPGRLVFTPLGSVIQRRYVTALIFLLQALSLILLLVSQSTPGIIAFVILFGAGFGAITPARAALVAEAYGPAHYGSISGVFALCVTASRAAAPVGAGLLHAWSGGYTTVLWLLVAVSALAAVAALRVRPAQREAAGGVLSQGATEGVKL
jgi:MFS family permease